LMAIAAFNLIILYPGTRLYYIYRNKQREKVWNAMTDEVRRTILSSAHESLLGVAMVLYRKKQNT